MELWLLDLNTEFVLDREAVFLWGVSEDGKRFLLIDNAVENFFFMVPLKGVNPEETAKEVFSEGRKYGVIKADVCDKRLLGKTVKAVRVYIDRSDNVERAARKLGKLKGLEKAYEGDIRLSTRYLLEKNLTLSSWFEVEVEEDASLPSIPNVKAFKVKIIKPLAEERVPKLRLMAVHFLRVGEKGSPKPEYDPVVAISVYDGKEMKQFRHDGKSDRALLEAFVKHVKEYDPDIIVGYGITEDWNYLVERCKRVDVPLEVGRNYARPHMSVFGHVSITGRISMDLLHNARENPQLTEYTLEEYARSLGLDVSQSIPEYEYGEYLGDPSKAEAIFRQSEGFAKLIYKIWTIIGDFAIQLSQITGLPLDHVFTASAGHRAEAYLMRQAYLMNELIPSRVEKPYVSYAGGLVLQPRKGIHENVIVIDFSSMYPNIMLKYNISPDTYVLSDKECENCFVSPESGHGFKVDYKGVYTNMLQSLIEARKETKEKLKLVEWDSVEYRVLDARQRTLKILANTLYGYAGWVGARWYLREVAEAVAEWGRHMISMAMEKAEQLGMEIIYGDTDSLFLRGERKMEELLRWVEEELGMEARVDKKYRRILFTEAKKRYGGLLEDGGLEVVGLEVVRGDWAEIAKEAQLETLRIMLETTDVNKAVSYVRNIVSKVRRGDFEMKKMIIWKRMTKPPEAYEVRAPHVLAALELSKKGWRIDVGDKVGYVIIRGTSKIGERAKPYQFVERENVDCEYYVKNQVIPAAMRILEVFGVSEQALLHEPRRGVMSFGTDG